MSQYATARRTALAAVALGLALTAAACGGADDDSVRLASGGASQGGAAPAGDQASGDQASGDQAPAGPQRPAEPAKGDPAPAAPAQPAQPAAVLPDGTYEVVVLAAEDGTVVVDTGRFVLGAPREPGVDSTAPVTFDTGTAAERLALPVADDARLVLQVAGVGTTAVPFGQLATAVDARVGDLLATVTVTDAEVTALEQLYRP